MRTTLRQIGYGLAAVMATLSAASVLAQGQSLSEDEHNNSASQTAGATEDEIARSIGLSGSFRTPGALQFNDAQIKSWQSAAQQARASLKVDAGIPSTQYDVIIQVGHYPRSAGRTGGQGKLISEQEAAAWVATMMAPKLKSAGLKTIIIPADDFTTGLKTRVFIALHTDSSAFQCRVGPSIGYGRAEDRMGMHALAVATAISLGIPPEQFMRHNYTTNLSGYYAYSRIDVSGYEGVLEMAELTCPDQEKSLLRSAPVLADNLVTAIRMSTKR